MPSVKLIAESGEREIDSNWLLQKTYKKRFLVQGTGYFNSDSAVSTVGVAEGDTYSDNPYAKCKKISTDRLFNLSSQCAWHVDIEWSTTTQQFNVNPLMVPAKRKVFTTEQQRHIFKDQAGNMISDSAGSPPDGGIPIQHNMPSVTWQRNEDASSFDMGTFAALTGMLNSDSFGGCDPGTLVLVAIADETFEGGYHFWQCTYQMIFNDQGWQPQFLNAGLFELKSGVRVRIKEDGKTPAQEPQPLTTAGVLVPVASRPGACNFITVTYHGTMAMSGLGLSLT